MKPQPWSVSADQLTKDLRVNRWHGLNASEARRRLKRRSSVRPKPPGAFSALVGQLADPLTWLLILLLALAIFEGQWVSVGALAAFVAARGWLGAVYQRLIDAAGGPSRPAVVARVIRDSVLQRTTADEFVAGDIVRLETGDQIPADGRLLEVTDLFVNETALTDVAEPVAKRAGLLAPETERARRSNMVYAGTVVTSGRAVFVVTAASERTAVAERSSEPGWPTAVIGGSNRWSGWWLGAIVGLAVIGLPLTLTSGRGVQPLIDIIIILLTVWPIGWALFTQALTARTLTGLKARRAALLSRQLEKVGAASAIVVELATLTEGQARAERLLVGGEAYRIDGRGYALSGRFWAEDEAIDITKRRAARQLLELCALAAQVSEADRQRDELRPLADPFAAALAVAAAKAGFYHQRLESELVLEGERPAGLDALLTRRVGSQTQLVVRGQVSAVLARCRSQLNQAGQVKPLLQESRNHWEAVSDGYAAEGYQTIAVAVADCPPRQTIQADQLPPLTLVGLVGIIDPLRPDARTMLTELGDLGLRRVIVSHQGTLYTQTASAKLGTGASVIASEVAAHHLPDDVQAVANATAGQTATLITQLQKTGHRVAALGSPAFIAAADLPMTFGEAAGAIELPAGDLLLVPLVIKAGRAYQQRLAAGAYYLLTATLAAALVVILTGLANWPTLSINQTLWFGLVTAVTGIGLAYQRSDDERQVQLFDAAWWRRLVLASLTSTAVSGLVLFFNRHQVSLLPTLTLTVLVFSQLANALVSRTMSQSSFRVALSANRPLLGLLAAALTAQLLIIYAPLSQQWLLTVSLPVSVLLVAAAATLAVIAVDELRQLTACCLHRWARQQL